MLKPCALHLLSHTAEKETAHSVGAPFYPGPGRGGASSCHPRSSVGLRSPATSKNNTIKTVNAPWRRNEVAGYSDLTVRYGVQGTDPSMCFGSCPSHGRCNSPKVSESALRA